MRLMYNLAPWPNYGAVFPFRDMVLGSPDFRNNPANQLPNCFTAGGSGAITYTIGFDAQGWPTSLSGPHGVYGSQSARCFLTDPNGYYHAPAGTYRLWAPAGCAGWVAVIWTGGATNSQVWYQFPAPNGYYDVAVGNPGDLTVATLDIELAETGGASYLRDVRLMMPDPAFASPTAPSAVPYAVGDSAPLWHDTYLAECRVGPPGMQAFRMMDLLGTNFSPVVDWTDVPACDANLRPLGQHSYGAPALVPYPVLINLAQTLNPAADLYWNVPAKATDAFVSTLAGFLRDNFPNKVYLEYSNEVWNSTFGGLPDGQYSYAAAQGESTLAGDPRLPAGVDAQDQNSRDFTYNRAFYYRRSREVHDLAIAAFAADPSPSRLVPVLSPFIYQGDFYKGTNAPIASLGALGTKLIINAYYGNNYYNGPAPAGVAATIAAGVPAILDSWDVGADVVRNDWFSTASLAAAESTTWLIYEGQFTPDGGLFASASNSADERQSFAVPAASGGTFTLTMPFSQAASLALPSPAQKIPTRTADATSAPIPYDATPDQVRLAFGPMGFADPITPNGVAVEVATTNPAGIGSPIAAGDVLTFTFGLNPDYPASPSEYGQATLNRTPLPMLTVQTQGLIPVVTVQPPGQAGAGLAVSAPALADVGQVALAVAASRVEAGRSSDADLLNALISGAMADPSMEGLMTRLLRRAATAGAEVFGVYSSTIAGAWGIKGYQGQDPSGRPAFKGVADYLANPSGYPPLPLPPPPLVISSFSISPTVLTSAQSFSGSVSISQAQGSDTGVAISAAQPGLFSALPASVTVPAGLTSAGFSGQVSPSNRSAATTSVAATLATDSHSVGVSIVPFQPKFTLDPADSRAPACVAFYPFDEGSDTTIHDNGPNGWHLQLSGGTLGSDTFREAGPGSGTAGIGRYSVRTAANGQWLCTMSGGPALHFSAFSAILQAEHAPDGSDAQYAVLGWLLDSGLYGFPMCRGYGGSEYFSELQDAQFPGANSATSVLKGDSTAEPSPGAWTQHGVACDASGASYYIGGSGPSRVAFPAAPSGVVTRLGIGGNGYIGHAFNGSVSAMAVFNRTLTADELRRPLSKLIVPIPVPRPRWCPPSPRALRPPPRPSRVVPRLTGPARPR